MNEKGKDRKDDVNQENLSYTDSTNAVQFMDVMIAMELKIIFTCQ